MPLPKTLIDEVLVYCDSHIGDASWFEAQFDFIEEPKLAKRLGVEFHSARYIYKLGEGLAVETHRLHAHLKFQIMQYASIYEAVVVHILFGECKDTPAVKKKTFHKVFRSEGKLPKNIRQLTRQDEDLYICAERKEATSPHSIKFGDKIAAAVELGMITEKLGEEICEFYTLRNAIHLETAVKKQVEYELKQAELAYRRMQPFLKGIRAFLATQAAAKAKPKAKAAKKP